MIQYIQIMIQVNGFGVFLVSLHVAILWIFQDIKSRSG